MRGLAQMIQQNFKHKLGVITSLADMQYGLLNHKHEILEQVLSERGFHIEFTNRNENNLPLQQMFKEQNEKLAEVFRDLGDKMVTL